MRKIPDIIKQTTRELRANMTPAEKVLWKYLRARKLWWYKFQRQYPLYVYTQDSWLDRYIIPDFICCEYKLIIELDWSVHDTLEIQQLDETKTELTQQLWITILRFTNEEIMSDIERVLGKIEMKLEQ